MAKTTRIQYQPRPGEARKWEAPWAQRVREVKAASIARWGAGYAPGHEPWRKEVADMMEREFGEEWAKARLEESRAMRQEQSNRALEFELLGMVTPHQALQNEEFLAEMFPAPPVIDTHMRSEKEYGGKYLESEMVFRRTSERNSQLYGDRTSEGSSTLIDNPHPAGAPTEFYSALLVIKEAYSETWEQLAARMGVCRQTMFRLAGGVGSIRPDGAPSTPSPANCRKLAALAHALGLSDQAWYFHWYAYRRRPHKYPRHRHPMPKSKAQLDAKRNLLSGADIAGTARLERNALRNRQRKAKALRELLADIRLSEAARRAG